MKLFGSGVTTYQFFFWNLDDDGWKKVDKYFCPFCNATYDTKNEAIVALENKNDKVIYDMFCDEVGYFCVCNYDDIVEQTHPRGIDCLYAKTGRRCKRKSVKQEL